VIKYIKSISKLPIALEAAAQAAKRDILAMIKIDVHQHLWTQPLIAALADRRELPFVRRDNDLTVLFLTGERPFVIDTCAESPGRRRALLELDSLDGALVCLSSPLGIESLPREQALPLIDAYHEGALSLGQPFGVWGAIALDRPDPADVDRALDRGCVGLSLPAGALASVEAISHLHPVLARLESRGAPLLVHPGPGPKPKPSAMEEASLSDPLWWPALTRYVAQMQAAWLAFVSVGRVEHRELRVVFSMLAGLSPLHAERLYLRGGPTPCLADPLVFYDTSCYGPIALRTLAAVVGYEQLLYGSDRPVVEPVEVDMPDELDWNAVSEGTSRAFGHSRTSVLRRALGGHSRYEPDTPPLAAR
jgi:6-methylsalicylate decarboxylase